tara:strand:+ start:1582 stop:1890 length:309 start_codon:yes stop_codon:yes gene_type:complete
MKKFKFFLIYLILLNSCGGGLKDAQKILKNEKIRTTDEFLVEKRKPLVLPPNYEEVLKPNSKIQKNNNQQEEIKKILKAPKDKNVKGNSSSTEESILNRIKK